ncbi:NHLP leader peptide family RiPP precursor [Phycisphaerales bacterium]|nr:NHLP leader peptide family RiPP precursor [Phycisphaerales bacterium]
MTEQKNQLATLFAACWKDEALKARLMADPKAVLAEHGMDVPDGMDVKVVENADNCVHITMPAPPSGSNKLSDEEVSNAAGGCSIAHCGDVWTG